MPTYSGAITAANISATGNVTGNYFIGNGSQLTGLPATYGNANVADYLPTYSGAITAANISATGNITGSYILGNGSQLTGLPATYGNANVVANLAALGSNPISTTGNIITQGIVSATGNITTSGYFVGNFAGNITGNLVAPGGNTQVFFNTTGNVDAVAGLTYDKDSNILTVLGNVSSGNVSATGNITGSYILGNGSQLTGLPETYGNANVVANLAALGSNPVSTTGNITAGYLFGNGSQLTGLPATYGNANVVANLAALGSNPVSSTGNVTAGNILTAGIVSAAGNVSGNYFIGNGSALTGISTVTPAKIANGTSQVNISASNGNANISINGTSNVIVVSTTGAYVTGIVSATGNVNAGNIASDGQISVTGNVTGGNINSGGFISTNSNVSGGNILTGGIISSTSNITGGNILTGGIISSTGNAIHGNLSVSTGEVTLGSIVNANGNGIGNIGSDSGSFNTIFAKATSAQYADLAEVYVSDTKYEPGTVLSFGGTQEVTLSTTDLDPTVAGVVSAQPSYIMNAGQQGEHVTMVALTGRVPVKVVGPVTKGAMMVSAGNGRARAESNPVMGTVIGKALKAFNGTEGVIEVVVGRL